MSRSSASPSSSRSIDLFDEKEQLTIVNTSVPSPRRQQRHERQSTHWNGTPQSHSRYRVCCVDMPHPSSDGDEASLQLDAVIGALEELLVDPEFTALQSAFLTQHARHFEPSSAINTAASTPNTLLHTQLHQQYNHTIESFLLDRLHATLPSFDLPSLAGLVAGRHSDAMSDGEEWSDVMEVLSGLSDYVVFKELMMDKRAEMDEEEESRRQAKAGKQAVKSKRQELNDFGLHITSLKQVQSKHGR